MLRSFRSVSTDVILISSRRAVASFLIPPHSLSSWAMVFDDLITESVTNIMNGTYNILNYGSQAYVGRAANEDMSTREKGLFCPPPNVRNDRSNILVSRHSSIRVDQPLNPRRFISSK
jgi:hypothetical protein